jgi:hypothetical protein
MAPAHSGLAVGDFAVIAITFGGEGGGFGGGGITAPRSLAGSLFIGTRLPERIALPAFAPVTSAVEWDAAARTLAAGSATADLWRTTLVGTDRQWVVYADSNAAPSWTLPTTPAGFADPAGAFARVESIDLAPGVLLDELIRPGGNTLRTLNDVSIGFGRFEAR